jgi:hypothetical protein
LVVAINTLYLMLFSELLCLFDIARCNCAGEMIALGAMRAAPRIPILSGVRAEFMDEFITRTL